MILATDVSYDDERGTALAAGVAFPDWKAGKVAAEYTVPVLGVQAYEPGAFYKRELPCLMALLAYMGAPPDIIVVDSYVDLGFARPGLGRHLYDAIGRRVPVIGVAKTRFAGAEAAEVLRGGSQSPLFVSSAGVEISVAAAAVREMQGPHRIPTMLKRVDALSRGR